MKIIKLHTINSTNTFLKDLVKTEQQESFTVVTAENQVSGRGQMENSWQSEAGKNLTFSVFVDNLNLEVNQQKYLSFVVSLSLIDTLKEFSIPNLKIKWPNDILSANKKICGVLIENQLKQKIIISSVIGIGLNVNQTAFGNLPNATSLKLISNKDYNIDLILNSTLKSLKKYTSTLMKSNFESLEVEYLDNLYKYQKPTMFKDKNNTIFMGKIVGIDSSQKLKVELENESIKYFDIKQVKFLKL